MIESDDSAQDRIFPVRWRRSGAAIPGLRSESVLDHYNLLLAAVLPETKEAAN
jgi:hypothetical protein